MTNSREEFIKKLQRRVAQAAIGSSALRNQGAPGVIGAARTTAAKFDLAEFGACRSDRFPLLLDRATDVMCASFPKDGRNWGAARKAVNLFLRDAVYNADLASRFALARMRAWLEVPLDRDVATQLIAEKEGANLPRWKSIKRLESDISKEFQRVASNVARRRGIERVDLDVYYWRPT